MTRAKRCSASLQCPGLSRKEKKEMHAQIIIETTVQERKEKAHAQIVTETKPEKEEGDHG